LDISGKKCVVIGGGPVAERKVCSLLEYHAEVTVISPKLTERLTLLYEEKKIYFINRIYLRGDLKDFYLVYVAVGDSVVNKECLEESKEEKNLINVVDVPNMSEFIAPAYIKKGDITVSISTNGKSPMLCRKIKEDIEELLKDISEEYINVLAELRNVVLNEVCAIEKRKKILEKIVYSDVMDRIKIGEKIDIRETLFKIYTDEKEN
ncbi:MAG: bifunctional precorrin-2 dehydrogenase/sirohydrochlorin ferrochelatase, partial [Alkaliphilus sp.]|nr:bifunctional precorrin-2 dehydrogenase/sirohydrochlorin ferrochelatase [Alkaliphilus sp.]